MPRPDLLAERLTAQRLTEPVVGDAVDVVRRLLAVQAQDPRGARLAIRARSTGLKAHDVDAALNDRSLVISTINRGTLHLMCSEDYWWLHRLTTPQLATASARRLEQEQVTPRAADLGVTAIVRTIEANGPTTRSQLRDAIDAAGVRVEGQAFIHIVLLATIRGLIVRGPMRGNEHAFVLVTDWLPKPTSDLDLDVAAGELARRYLIGHGPASDADLARWAGITLGAARRGLASISSSLVDREDGLAQLPDSAGVALPAPRLLGAFDPSLLGWVSRDDIVGSHQGIVTSNGVFRPFAMVEGRAVATWSLARGKISIEPLEPVSSRVQRTLDADAAAVRDFLD